MKIKNLKTIIFLVLITFVNTEMVSAQEESLGTMVTKKVGMYVFPAEGQSEDQTEADETACYKWAVEQSGVDPLNQEKVEGAAVDQGPDGEAVKGAARGALVGLAIGSISGNAGDGAAYGAIGGALGGRRRGNQAKKQQQHANDQAANQINAEMINSFKKAYSVCLEGKGYSVK